MTSPGPPAGPYSQAELEPLLEFIMASRGVDFRGYKRTTLGRRFQKRMTDVGIESLEEYRDLLEVNAEEFTQLFNTLLINVTGFFRDRPAWDFLRERIVPSLVERKRDDEPIRVWCAGCASGQEAYTIAMVLAEALGPGDCRDQMKIYATDIDDDALGQARQGAYSLKELADVPEHLLDKYFESVGTRFAFKGGLRRAVIFGRHDLTTDAPIGRLDLLSCRNTLMYFNAEAQARILDRFHFALDPEGYLFLGKAEMLLSHGQLFTPLNVKYRVFLKAGPDARQVPATSSIGMPAEPVEPRGSRHLRLRDVVLDVVPFAVIAVDAEGSLVAANSEARGLFGLTSIDLGKPLQNLEVSYRPVELRSRLEQAYSERRAVYVRSAERPFPDGQTQYLDVTVTPLWGPDDTTIGASISFADVTSLNRMREELQRAREDLETTYEELRSSNEELETTNEELHSSNEELETTNEELQSTNEELETTNEELQSSNEELETMNEELRSTNEALEAANSELQGRTDEVEHLNQRLQSLLSSLSSAIVVIDRELIVILWNLAAEHLWGLRSSEVVGRSFPGLEIGLPLAGIQPMIRACLDGRSEGERLEVEGVSRTGRPLRLRVVCSPVAGSAPPRGAILAIDEVGT